MHIYEGREENGGTLVHQERLTQKCQWLRGRRASWREREEDIKRVPAGRYSKFSMQPVRVNGIELKEPREKSSRGSGCSKYTIYMQSMYRLEIPWRTNDPSVPYFKPSPRSLAQGNIGKLWNFSPPNRLPPSRDFDGQRRAAGLPKNLCVQDNTRLTASDELQDARSFETRTRISCCFTSDANPRDVSNKFSIDRCN